MAKYNPLNNSHPKLIATCTSITGNNSSVVANGFVPLYMCYCQNGIKAIWNDYKTM